MKKIDLESWGRKDIYAFYRNVDVPQYQMTFELDVTHLYQYVKSKGYSFYFTMIYLAMKTLDSIENFRYRFIHQEPYLMESTHPSFTDRIEGTDRFKIVTVNMTESLETFLRMAKAASDRQGDRFINPQEELRHDLVYITTFPWASFTQVSHAHNIDRFDAVPRLVWGKFRKVSERLIMPFGIQTHHMFADGLHVGTFIERLQEALNHIS